MRTRSAQVLGALLVTGLLASCAASADADDAATPDSPPRQTEPATSSSGADDTAAERAQAWLDAAALPPGAVRSEVPVGAFNSYIAWPCGPAEELEAFWTIEGATVTETTNWLRENPTADLISTAVGPPLGDEDYDEATVGYIPEQDAQEGVVYTIAKTSDGVAVRAAVAALTESASCPTLPNGGSYGAPGQG